MGAIIRAPTASFSNSCDVARASPTTPAKVMAAQRTPGPVSIALRFVGSIAIAKIAITSDANITIAIAMSRLRDSMRNSLSVRAQIIAREAVNPEVTVKSRVQDARRGNRLTISAESTMSSGLCVATSTARSLAFPLFDDAY